MAKLSISKVRKEPWLARMEEMPDNPETVAFWEEVSGLSVENLSADIAKQSDYDRGVSSICAKALLMVVATAIDNETTLYDACKKSRVSMTTINRWRRQMPVVNEVINVLDEVINARIEHEIYDRAVNGWYEDVWHQGDAVGTKLMRSHDLLKFHAQANNAKYAPKQQIKQEISGPAGDAVQIDTKLLRGMSNDELTFLEQMINKAAEIGA